MTIRNANATAQNPEPRGRPYASGTSGASEAATSGTGPPSLTRAAICRCQDRHCSGERSSPNPGDSGLPQVPCHDAGMGATRDPGPARAAEPLDGEFARSLPMSLSSFVGRDRELDELRSLLRAGKRLVTLVGIGGVGTNPAGPYDGGRLP